MSTSTLTPGEETIYAIEAIKRTGLQVAKIATNDLTVVMPLESNANHTGIMYAGSLFALGECAPGVLFMNKFAGTNIVPICASVDIRFRRPAMSDIAAHVHISDEQYQQLEQDVNANGKAKCDFEIKLVDADEQVVSIAKIQYALLKIK